MNLIVQLFVANLPSFHVIAQLIAKPLQAPADVSIPVTQSRRDLKMIVGVQTLEVLSTLST